MSLTFNVNGTDLAAWVDVPTFKIEQVLTRRGDTARILVKDVGNALSIGRFSPVTITDDVGNVIFKGWITKDRQSCPDVNTRYFDITCQDATLFCNGRLASKAYVNSHVTDIARDMVLNASPPVGITCNNTPAGLGFQLPGFRVNRGSLAAELTRLAKMASIGLIWDWYVDYNSDLHFFYASQAPLSPVVLTDQDPPLPANYWWYDRSTFYYETDDTQLGNQVTVRGGTYLSNVYLQTWVGNGNQTSFPFDYPPDVQLAGLPTVTVGGVAQSVAQDSGGTPSTQWLVSQAAVTSGYVLKVGTASAPGSGVVVQASYQYDLPVLVRTQQPTQIAALNNLPNQGVFERYIVDTTLISKTSAHQRATAEISVYAQSYINCHIEIQDTAGGANGLGALFPGQKVQLINSQLGINTTLLILKQIIVGTKGQFYRRQLDLQG